MSGERGVGRVVGFGDRAVLVELASTRWRAPLVDGISQHLPQARVRGGLESVLVEWAEPAAGLVDRVREALASLGTSLTSFTSSASASRTVAIPVIYDGPDLRAAAAALSCTPAEVVAAHRAQRWSVAMMGFAPGFAYLVPEGPVMAAWDTVRRLDTPRERVASGSVAVAAGMSAVYPAAMPGGWLLLGHTTVRLFDPGESSHPTLLVPGDEVVFTEARP